VKGIAPLLAASLALAAPASASAAEMTSILQGARENPSDVGFPFVRCASLYGAFLQYARSLAPSAAPSIESSIATLLEAGAAARHVSVSDLRAEAGEDAVIYARRLEQNYRTGGDPFQGDTVVQSDVRFCKTLTDRLEQQ
jgi:hypothetical protein